MINKLYTYIITADNGMSPCYDNNVYSLACCKPQIRRIIFKNYQNEIKNGTANIWVMGVRRDKTVGKAFIVYLSKITDIVKYEYYYCDNGKYVSRSDCNYRGIKTLEELPICTHKGDGILDKLLPELNAKKDNEHGEFKNINELNGFSKAKYDRIARDICGKAVLISEHFIHCSQIDKKDNFALTKLFGDCFNELLDGYKKNQRHYHSFDAWDDFKKTISKINFENSNRIICLDSNTCGCC